MRKHPQYLPTINGIPILHLGTYRHQQTAASAAYEETKMHPEKYPEPRSVASCSVAQANEKPQ